MISEKNAPGPDVGGGTYLQFFQNQQLGMYLSGAWWAKYMPKVPFQWTAAPLPAFGGHLGSKVEIDSLSISASSKNPEGAWALVKALTDRRGLELWTAIGTPTRRSVLNSKVFKSNPHVPAVVLMLGKSEFTPFTKAGAAVDTQAMTALAPLWQGKKRATAALGDAAGRITKAIAP
jgi:ABC-type glycerol-3-phosphate transport system substrate-binding protein